MTSVQADQPSPRKPLRVWPGVAAAVLLLLARFGVKAVIPGFSGFSLGMIWAFGGAAAVLLWWLLASRAPWLERLAVIALLAAGLWGSWQLRHGSMGPLWLVGYALPSFCLALVVGAVIGRRLPDRPRRATIAAAILLVCGGWLLLRTKGISGDHVMEFHWRWTQSTEERLVTEARRAPAAPAAARPSALPTIPSTPAAPKQPEASKAPPAQPKASGEWPSFRGPGRDGVVRGVRIATDWKTSPPVELWRRPIGPGWSSFAVRGNRIYTQEQRGDDEVVACYDATTGEPVWTHRDAVRFFEANAGPGPRATPTLDDGRVYAFGATGILNALDAASGALAWSRDATSGGKTKVPDWGFASSPLVAGDLVIVAVAGQLIAYETATGKPRWVGPAGGVSYSSPQLMTIDGVHQVLLLSGAGATSLSLGDGKQLWQHRWRGWFPIVQPAQTADGDVLIVAASDSGTRRIAVANGPGGWTVESRWTSSGLKPYFNDFVVHGGHAFGFDGRILACIDLVDGTRKWKGGRYGNGQLVLLPEQDLLLVLSEEGELALIKATPDQFTELARFKAIEGKTWNHPALVGDVLFVRNGEEMAAFRLPLAGA